MSSLCSMLAIAQQDVTLKFTSTSYSGSYVPFDVVNVTNITRGWTESLLYPDTTLVLTSFCGLLDSYSNEDFFSEACPNPFLGKTDVTFSIEQAGTVRAKLLNINGSVLCEFSDNLDGGSYQISMNVEKPQLVVLHVKINDYQCAKKILNIGYGDENRITINRISDTRVFKKSRSGGDFFLGDVMSYMAVAIHNGDLIESDRVTKAQYTNEIIMLPFRFTNPTVVTSNVHDVSFNSAISGGVVTSDGNGTISARGICWSTTPNPTIFNTHTIDGSGLGAFVSYLEGLTENTTYYVRAYATNDAGTSYGDEIIFTTELMVGSLPGLFSINDNQHIRFSKGNLQYIGNTSSPYWKFADNQWDFLGSSQDGWSENVDRDLFGWGTSGYNHGALSYQPWSTSLYSNQYYAYGNYNYSLFDQTGKADWGYNPISNGGNMENQWRTLTRAEWQYIFHYRNTITGIRYVKARVNGVCGIVLLPDNWVSSIYTLNNPNGGTFDSNVISSEEWVNVLEPNGAVFLPGAGHRYSTSHYAGNDNFGSYWTSTYYNNTHACSVYFNIDNINISDQSGRFYGFAVRLIRDVE